MKVKEIFDLGTDLIDQISYMVNNYIEDDHGLDDIPTQTLDDIIDEIKDESSEPNPEEEPTEDPEEVTEDTPEEDPKPPTAMDPYLTQINILITRFNALKNNATIGCMMDADADNITDMNVSYLCAQLFEVISGVYSICSGISRVFNSDTNENISSKCIYAAYGYLVRFTETVKNIYGTLNARDYLKSVNGPVEKDYVYWMTIVEPSYLTDIKTWRDTDEVTKLDVIDKAIQLALKYAALLKKLVLSEFKGFDEYYAKLMEFIKGISGVVDNIHNYYYDMTMTNAENLNADIVLAKTSTISTLTRGYILCNPETT